MLGRRHFVALAASFLIDIRVQAVAIPAKMLFLMIAWIPIAVTTRVTPKSTPTDISEIASSSLIPGGHQEVPHLAEASRSARSIEDFE